MVKGVVGRSAASTHDRCSPDRSELRPNGGPEAHSVSVHVHQADGADVGLFEGDSLALSAPSA